MRLRRFGGPLLRGLGMNRETGAVYAASACGVFDLTLSSASPRTARVTQRQEQGRSSALQLGRVLIRSLELLPGLVSTSSFATICREQAGSSIKPSEPWWPMEWATEGPARGWSEPA